MNIRKLIQSAFENYRAGELLQAEHICKKILIQKSNDADVLNLLGIIYYQFGNHDLAIEYIRKGLHVNPANADAYYNLGNIFLEKGQVNEAMQCFRRAVQLNPEIAEAYNNLGFAVQELGDRNEALSCFQKAIQINPFFVDAFYNIANTLKEEGSYDEALRYYQKTIEIDPSFVMAYYSQGQLYHEKKEFAKAIASYLKAIELNPSNPEAYNNIGIAFQEQGEYDEAITWYKKALGIDPHFQKAIANMGNVLHRKGQYDGARDYYRQALKYNSDHLDVRFNISLIDLVEGKYMEGWKGYGCRWKLKDFQQNSYSQPSWNGSDIQGLTILLHAEQGYGDTIQFIRYVPLVAEKGARVILKCMKELRSLLQSVEGVNEIIWDSEHLPEFHMQCPIMRLPLIFNTITGTIPSAVPYVKANAELTLKWRSRIYQDTPGFKIGLSWCGNPDHSNDRNRSCSLEYFGLLSQLKNTIFYSLQKGKGAEQAKKPPEGMKFIDRTEEINDFSDTAALIENLDLVISVDTAVAHLAGALGKPVWTILPFVPDWRWMLNRNDSPWYPTMRLFRQQKPNDWATVIFDVARELVNFKKIFQ